MTGPYLSGQGRNKLFSSPDHSCSRGWSRDSRTNKRTTDRMSIKDQEQQGKDESKSKGDPKNMRKKGKKGSAQPHALPHRLAAHVEHDVEQPHVAKRCSKCEWREVVLWTKGSSCVCPQKYQRQQRLSCGLCNRVCPNPNLQHRLLSIRTSFLMCRFAPLVCNRAKSFAHTPL